MSRRITARLLVLGCFRGQFHSYNSVEGDLAGESILYFPLRATGRSRATRLLGEEGTMSGVWLLAVALPLRSASQSTNLTKPFVAWAVLDLMAIPWPSGRNFESHPPYHSFKAYP